MAQSLVQVEQIWVENGNRSVTLGLGGKEDREIWQWGRAKMLVFSFTGKGLLDILNQAGLENL